METERVWHRRKRTRMSDAVGAETSDPADDPNQEAGVSSDDSSAR
jgi:hypothetical protein